MALVPEGPCVHVVCFCGFFFFSFSIKLQSIWCCGRLHYTTHHHHPIIPSSSNPPANHLNHPVSLVHNIPVLWCELLEHHLIIQVFSQRIMDTRNLKVLKLRYIIDKRIFVHLWEIVDRLIHSLVRFKKNCGWDVTFKMERIWIFLGTVTSKLTTLPLHLLLYQLFTAISFLVLMIRLGLARRTISMIVVGGSSAKASYINGDVVQPCKQVPHPESNYTWHRSYYWGEVGGGREEEEVMEGGSNCDVSVLNPTLQEL